MLLGRKAHQSLTGNGPHVQVVNRTGAGADKRLPTRDEKSDPAAPAGPTATGCAASGRAIRSKRARGHRRCPVGQIDTPSAAVAGHSHRPHSVASRVLRWRRLPLTGLRVGSAPLIHSFLKLWPASCTKRIARNAIDRHNAKQVEWVVVKDAGEISVLCQKSHAFNGIKKTTRRLLTESFVEMAAHNFHGQMGLSNTLRVSLDGQLCQILQSTFENVEWMQHPKPCSVRESQYGRSPSNALGRETDGAAQKIDLFDPLSLDRPGELGDLRSGVIRGRLPVFPA